MRLSLKWKFGLLMAGFVITISLIILINFRTAGSVANELNQVQAKYFPQFSRVTSMEARFRTISRLLEDTVVLGERGFLDSAEEEREMFLRDLENLEQVLPPNATEDVELIRTIFNAYYARAEDRPSIARAATAGADRRDHPWRTGGAADARSRLHLEPHGPGFPLADCHAQLRFEAPREGVAYQSDRA